MSQLWVVKLTEPIGEIAEESDISFIDIRGIYDNYVGFERKIFSELLENFNKFEKYAKVAKIQEIISPDGEDLSDKPIVMLVGLDRNDLKFGILLFLSEEDVVILGLWPEQFFDAVKSDENILTGAIVAFIKAPENWKIVNLILPSQKEINENEVS